MRLSRNSMILAVVLAFGCSKKAPDMSKGGVELTFAAALPAGTGEARATELVQAARKVVVERLKSIKVTAVVKADGQELKVGLPGKPSAETIAAAKAVVAPVGKLELREIDDGAALRELTGKLPEEEASVERDSWADANGGQHGAYFIEAASEEIARKHAAQVTLPADAMLVVDPGIKNVRLFVAKAPTITEESIKGASAPEDQYLPPEVALTFSEAGATKYKDLTKRAFGRKVAAVLDGKIADVTVVMQTATEGKATVTVSSGADKTARQLEARRLAAVLRSGPLPVALTFKDESQVFPK